MWFQNMDRPKGESLMYVMMQHKCNNLLLMFRIQGTESTLEEIRAHRAFHCLGYIFFNASVQNFFNANVNQTKLLKAMVCCRHRTYASEVHLIAKNLQTFMILWNMQIEWKAFRDELVCCMCIVSVQCYVFLQVASGIVLKQTERSSKLGDYRNILLALVSGQFCSAYIRDVKV